MLGAGIATCLSNCVAFLYFLFVLLRIGRTSAVTFSPKVGLPRRVNMLGVLAVGIPSAVASLLFDLDYVIIDKLMVSYHDLALAAIGIVLKVERFPLNVGIGICQGMMPLVAYNFSARNEKRTHDTNLHPQHWKRNRSGFLQHAARGKEGFYLPQNIKRYPRYAPLLWGLQSHRLY